MSRPLPPWCRLVRAPNPGPMTLEGTNTWVLDADEGVVVVDPGPLDERHLAAVAAVAHPAPVLLTVLTHRHPDHAAGVDRFATLTGAPVLARDPALCQGAEPLPAGERRWRTGGLALRAVPTPGHTSDSVTLVAERDGRCALLTGDTVLGRGTTVVAHPDGRLGDYLDSLERLRRLVTDLDEPVLLPGHGPAGAAPGPVLEAYLTHRHERLEQVRAALAAGARDAAEVVRTVYADVDPRVWPAAEQSVRAQIDHLRG